ncbi:hypothetical protein AP071_10615 [Rhodobacter capsulatus]|nr:hypothetical protein AP073_10790 [Rhodobacter capsulatus]KQB17008.1 hypothetical protein AP071_10615 [Rhodobacter capsulatus]
MAVPSPGRIMVASSQMVSVDAAGVFRPFGHPEPFWPGLSQFPAPAATAINSGRAGSLCAPGQHELALRMYRLSALIP